MRYCQSDGGRHKAGFKGQVGDCVTRSISIATELPYLFVYDTINGMAKRERVTKKKDISSARNGVHDSTYKRFLKRLGWCWTSMGGFQRKRVPLRDWEAPPGRLVVLTCEQGSPDGHMVAVINGVLRDNRNSAKSGKHLVCGYWEKK